MSHTPDSASDKKRHHPPQECLTKLDQLGIVVFVVIVIAVWFFARDQQMIDEQRRYMHSFTDTFLSTVRLGSHSHSQRYELINYLAWIACFRTIERCRVEPCFRHVFIQNQTSIDALCDAVRHDCVVSERCSIWADCRSEGRISVWLGQLIVHPCNDEPASDWEMASHLTWKDPETQAQAAQKDKESSDKSDVENWAQRIWIGDWPWPWISLLSVVGINIGIGLIIGLPIIR